MLYCNHKRTRNNTNQINGGINITLYSYNTPIIKKLVDGSLVKLWEGWTATTGRHIKAFCGLSKTEYMNL